MKIKFKQHGWFFKEDFKEIITGGFNRYYYNFSDFRDQFVAGSSNGKILWRQWDTDINFIKSKLEESFSPLNRTLIIKNFVEENLKEKYENKV